MSSRKRPFQAVDDAAGDGTPSLLHRIRNMWQFANLCQWIYTFGKAAKIDESIDIEEIEAECLKPTSTMLGDIALSLLKLVSSHRGLTHDIFDDQARKQYLSKSPDRNPFGTSDEPLRFTDFDIFTKIRVMQQLTQWIMIHPERIREKMEEQRDVEQASWRIEPYGWDSEDRTYFVLDDNRVYRLTEPPPSLPATKSKKPRTSRPGRRSSKRRRVTISTEEPSNEASEELPEEAEPVDDGLGGMTWECIAVSLDDVRRLLDGFRKTRDENEKILRRQLEDHLVPILEKQEESRKRKEIQRERDLLNLARLANAKRSSRIASKIEQQKEEDRAREEEQQQREVKAAKRREEQTLLKLQKERDFRLASRAQRLQERESRRRRHEEELAQLSEDSKSVTSGNGRISERRLLVEIERNKQALKDLEQEEEDWVFDCVCGMYGHVDDGTHSVACEKCNIWQHSKCLGISEEEAERPEFHFLCSSCKHRGEQAKTRPKPTIKLKLNPPSSSPSQPEQGQTTVDKSSSLVVELSAKPAFIMPLDPVSVAQKSDSQDPEIGHAASPGPAAAIVSEANNAVPNGKASLNHQSHSSRLAPEVVHSEAAPALKSMNGSPLGHTSIEARKDDGHSITATGQSPMRSSPLAPPKITDGTPILQDRDRSNGPLPNTPQISRDLNGTPFFANGTLPAQAGGLSPTKHSPPRPADPLNPSRIGSTTPILPPVTLSPSPRQIVLTPPSKSAEPFRPLGGR